jgi:phenylpropionate dioxygenase-like ring-hydroxylating dioxygenase large terminal subunit
MSFDCQRKAHVIGGLKIVPEVRPDFVPVDAYVSKDIVQLEKQKLWPKVWLIACREEELKKVGDYVTFDIADESILVLRTSPDEIKAFYNVCQHRGRRLKDDAAGNTGRVVRCRFHGWKYNLDGSVNDILCRHDWEGCPEFTDADLNLQPVRMEKWAGWVWVSMNPDIEPLLDYLAPIPSLLDPFEMEDMRFATYQSLVVPCNWKVVVDAFNEAYHSVATHPATFPYGWPGSTTAALGKHGSFTMKTFLDPSIPGAAPVPAEEPDIRQRMLDFTLDMRNRAKSMMTEYGVTAGRRLLDLPADMPAAEVMGVWVQYHQEEMEKAGVKWPSGMNAALANVATDYHVFPNTTMVPCTDSVLWHRMRPNGDDPASCIWDIWALERFPPGGEPPLKREVFNSPDEFKGRNAFLEEDFGNMMQVQKGMLSRGFKGARTNPVQEISVSNFHKVLYEYLSAPD